MRRLISDLFERVLDKLSGRWEVKDPHDRWCSCDLI
jgi:hypothetical protein